MKEKDRVTPTPKEKLWCNKVLEMGNTTKFAAVFAFSNLIDGVTLNIKSSKN